MVSPLLANLYMNRLPEALAYERTGHRLSGSHHRLCRRLRHPQPRSRGRGSGVDAAGDGPARARPQRGEDLGSGCSARALRLPWLYVRSAPLSQGWLLVSRGEPVEESVLRLTGRVSDLLVPGNMGAWHEVRDRLSRLVGGWAAYFSYGTRLMAYRAVDNHVYDRVRHFLVRRHKVPSRGTKRYPMGWCSATSACCGSAGFILAPCRVPRGEASRKAGCGKSARPV